MSQHDQDEISKVCLECNRENASYAVRCFHCGAQLLAPDTLPIETDDIPASRLTEVSHEMLTVRHDVLYEGVLFLYPLDYSQSVIVVERQDMILGRRTADDPPSPGDLTSYDAYALGVSRNHAMISYANEHYTIKDMGSANGTWVNGRRLPPHEPYTLKKGDRIWLGKLVLLAYLA